MPRTRSLVSALLLAVLGASPAAAQIVRGTVVEESTGAAISGAVVVLLDPDGKRVTGVFADDGRFAIRAPGPGRYMLRADRIGFRSPPSPVFEIAAGQTLEMRLATRAVPVVLSAVQVVEDAKCVAKPGEGEQVSRVWEEAKKALYATTLAQDQKLFSVRLQRYVRQVHPTSERVIWQRASEMAGITSNPFVSLPASELSRHGYLRPDSAGAVYYAPDAQVLLSDEFVGDHCFRVQRGDGEHRGQIGLAFEPVKRRKLTDVAGVMWIDAQTSELRTLDYRYTEVPDMPRSSARDKLGGRVEFKPLPNGAWIVQRWVIRMPVLGPADPSARRERSIIPGRPIDDVLVLKAIQEEGGEVVEATGADGRRTQVARATLAGTVFDSTRGRPLAAAKVFLSGTQYSAETDSAGRFRMDGLPDGAYELGAIHPRLDTLGARVPIRLVTLRRGEETSADLAVPSLATVATSLCADSLRREGEGVVRGVVRDTTGAPAAGAEVTLMWISANVGPRNFSAGARTLTTETDGRGYYTLCGVPDRPGAMAQARLGTRMSERADVAVKPGTVTLHDITLAERVVARAPSAETLLPRVEVRESPSTMMTAFEERRRRGHGYFLAGAEIDRLHATRMTDVLRTVPVIGARLASTSAGDGVIAQSRARSPVPFRIPSARDSTQAPADTIPTVLRRTTEQTCRIAYYLDGAYFEPITTIDEEIHPSQVAAIEVYRDGQAPPQFAGHPAECGVVAIWTKSGSGRLNQTPKP